MTGKMQAKPDGKQLRNLRDRLRLDRTEGSPTRGMYTAELNYIANRPDMPSAFGLYKELLTASGMADRIPAVDTPPPAQPGEGISYGVVNVALSEGDYKRLIEFIDQQLPNAARHASR